MLCEACARNAMQAQAPAAAPPPQGLAANLAKLAGRPQGPGAGLPQGPGAPGLPQGPGAPGLPQGPGNGVGVPAGAWGRKLEANEAGAASNAEEFTKQFMQQLAGGQ